MIDESSFKKHKKTETLLSKLNWINYEMYSSYYLKHKETNKSETKKIF